MGEVKRRYILFLLTLIVPVMVFANSTVNLKQESKQPSSIDTPKKVKVIFNSLDEFKAQGDILKGDVLFKLVPDSEIDLNGEYTFIYAERIGSTNKIITTYEQKVEKSYVEKYSSEVRVIYDNWNECKKQGDMVKGKVLHTLNFAERIDLEANYYFTEAHRIKGTDRVVTTYKLKQ